MSFNPQPRVAADLTNKAMAVGGAVSIHSRAWRLTKTAGQSHVEQLVSIHSRAWRLTKHLPYWMHKIFRFNPQPRVAADL